MKLFDKKEVSSDRLRVAVVGVGHLGQHHARIYNELKNDVELVAVSDIDENRAQEIAKKNKTIYVTDFRELLNMNLDAVTIAAPTSLHFDIAKEFLARSIPALIEKPVCATLKQADDLNRIASENNTIIQVGHVERFNPAIIKLTKIVKDPKFIEVHRLAPYNPRGIDVSVVLDLMIHDLDIILHLVNRPIAQIDAVGVDVLTTSEDIANVRVTFEGGCVANITASRISLKEMRKIRIFQPYTYISLDYKAQEGVIYSKENDSIKRETLDLTKGEPLKLEIESFVNAVKNKTTPEVSGTDGRNALAAATEINRQIEEKKKVLAP
ncbi:MAG: Gfo/Idh/MocA family oxidoreductase [Candidatus Auribacterota bacterium]|jgi:predicted dehydrogenase|nr:Gfo/Idh/MocA family oxidoreductase [Candidatus Auribacterota bacterium]